MDTGLAIIVDIETRDAFIEFEQQWEKENPNNNIYDNLLAEEFKKNAEKIQNFKEKMEIGLIFKYPIQT